MEPRFDGMAPPVQPRCRTQNTLPPKSRRPTSRTSEWLILTPSPCLAAAVRRTQSHSISALPRLLSRQSTRLAARKGSHPEVARRFMEPTWWASPHWPRALRHCLSRWAEQRSPSRALRLPYSTFRRCRLISKFPLFAFLDPRKPRSLSLRVNSATRWTSRWCPTHRPYSQPIVKDRDKPRHLSELRPLWLPQPARSLDRAPSRRAKSLRYSAPGSELSPALSTPGNPRHPIHRQPPSLLPWSPSEISRRRSRSPVSRLAMSDFIRSMCKFLQAPQAVRQSRSYFRLAESPPTPLQSLLSNLTHSA